MRRAISAGAVAVLFAAASVVVALRDPTPAPAGPALDPGGGAVSTTAAAETTDRFTIIASGDVLIHSAVWERAQVNGQASGKAFDFKPMFAKIRPLVKAADLGICHMEVPLGAPAPYSSYPVFNAPPPVASGVRSAGYDTCSTASNHSYDKGTPGVTSTIDNLHRRGLLHEGTAKRRRGGRRAAIYDVKGVKVAHLSFTYGLNGFRLPEGQSWLVNVIDADEILRQARNARKAGADFVVLSLHWGNEYQRIPSTFQTELAKRLTNAGPIDVILGHHAHVVQGIRPVNHRFVVYGMGNSISAQHTPVDTQDGLLVKLVVENVRGRWRVTRIRYTPTWVERGTYRILPVARMLNDPATSDALRPTLRASWSRTLDAVRSLGRFRRVKPSEWPKA